MWSYSENSADKEQAFLKSIHLFIPEQEYCWLENVKGHFVENVLLESLSPISLHYKTGPLFQNEGAILKIKGHICPWPLPKLSLLRRAPLFQVQGERLEGNMGETILKIYGQIFYWVVKL